MNLFLVRFQRVTSIWRMCLALGIVVCCAELRAPRLGAQTETPASGTEVKPITEDEAHAFAEALIEAVNTGDFDSPNELIDWHGVLDKATAIPKSDKLKEAREVFQRGALSEASGTRGVLGQIHAGIRQGGNYKALRVNVTDKLPYVMLRLKAAQGRGVNYHQYFLGRQPDGSVMASDLFIFLTGERMSETMHRTWLPIATQLLKSNGENPGEELEPVLANVRHLTKLVELNSKQQFAEALEHYRELPEPLRKDKSLLVQRLLAAQRVSEEEYGKAIEDFRKYHPSDVALDFLLIDGYTILKQHDLALKSIDRANQQVGGDALLLVTRAKSLLQLNRVADARQSIANAIQSEPDLVDAYVIGLDVSLAGQNFDDTATCLTILQTQFGAMFKDLREVPAFGEFVKSSQYRKWLESQQKEAPKGGSGS